MFEKAGQILPSFLSFEPIPESKIFEKNRKSPKPKAKTEIGTPKPLSDVIKCSNLSNIGIPVRGNGRPLISLSTSSSQLTIRDEKLATNGFTVVTKCDVVVNGSKKCDVLNGSSSKKGFSSLMPPPSFKLSDASKSIVSSKVVKKRPFALQNTAVSLKTGVCSKTGVVVDNSIKSKRFSCTDCDLGVTFRSKIDLQHHQSGMITTSHSLLPL